ncbi:hypothetical protein ACR6C2_34385 [Streptomyces sp. INA 01156]
MQQAILTHDPSLEAPQAVGGREAVTVTPAAPPAGSPAMPADSPSAEDPCLTGPHESRTASVVMFRFRLGEELGRVLVEDRDRVLDALTQVAREKAELHGGRVTAVLGSTVLAVFAGTDPAEGAEQAVRAAAAVRDSLSFPTGTLAPPQAAVRGLTVHTAVASGEALLSRWPAENVLPPWVGGRLVDACRTMLADVQAGRSTSATRRAGGARGRQRSVVPAPRPSPRGNCTCSRAMSRSCPTAGQARATMSVSWSSRSTRCCARSSARPHT